LSKKCTFLMMMMMMQKMEAHQMNQLARRFEYLMQIKINNCKWLKNTVLC
jgi:hypothetical protein